MAKNANNSSQPPTTRALTVVEITDPAQMPLTLAKDGNMRWHPTAGNKYITQKSLIIPLIALPEAINGIVPPAIEIEPSNQTDALLFNGSTIPHIWGRNNGTFTIRKAVLVDISNGGFGGGTVLFDLVGFGTSATLITDNVVPILFKSVGNLVDMLVDVNSSTCVSCLSGLVMRDTVPLGVSMGGFISLNPFAVAVTAPTLCFMGDFSTVSSSIGNFEQIASGVSICIDSAATGIYDILGNSFDGTGKFYAEPIIKSITAFANADIAISAFSNSTENPGVDTTVEFAGITDAIIGQEILIADEAAYDGLHTIVRVADDQLSFDINVAFSTSGAATLKRTQVTSVGHFMVRDQTNTISGTTNYNGTQQIFKLIDNDNFLISVAFVADDATGTATATSKNQKSDGVVSALNGKAPDSKILGAAASNAQVTATTPTDGTYASTNFGTVVLDTVSERVSLTTPAQLIFTYNGDKDVTLKISGPLNGSKSGANRDYRFAPSVNGAVPIFASASYAPWEMQSVNTNIVVEFFVDVEPGDTIQIMSAGDGTTDAFTISDVLVSAEEV